MSWKKTSYLSKPEWKTIPWRLRSKTLLDKLLDVFVDVPTILEEFNQLLAIKDPTSSDLFRAGLRSRSHNVLEGLTAWRQEAGDILETFDYTIVGSEIPTPENVAVASIIHTSALYWMVCIVASTTHHYCCRPIQVEEEKLDIGQYGYKCAYWPQYCGKAARETVDSMPESTKTDERWTLDPTINAFKIARAIHIYIDPKFGLCFKTNAIFPLSVALNFLILSEPPDSLSEEVKLLLSAFAEPAMATYTDMIFMTIRSSISEGKKQLIQDFAGDYIRF